MTTLSAQPMLAKAQDAATIADARCVVIGMQIYESGDSARQATGMWLSLYYLGLIHGRAPQLDIERLIEDEARKMVTVLVTNSGGVVAQNNYDPYGNKTAVSGTLVSD